MRYRALAIMGAAIALAVPAPVARAAVTAYAIEVSATAVEVGDTLTITPVVTDGEPPTANVRCTLAIEGDSTGGNHVRMSVASNGCEPWTFTVPPSPQGQYVITGHAWAGLSGGAPASVVLAPGRVIDIVSGGTPVPFVTNYPVQSWALSDLVSDPTSTYGEPLTINPRAGANGCEMRILGGFELASTRQLTSCVPWTFTIPEREPQGPGNIFLESADARVMSWTGVSPYSNTDPEAGLVGQMYGETYAVNLASFQPATNPAATYASNLPAMFAGPQRAYTGLVGDPAGLLLAPVVIGLAEGTCAYSVGLTLDDPGPSTTPVVPGGCEDPAAIPAFEGETNAISIVYFELRDGLGKVVAKSQQDIGWVLEMAPLEVDAPPESETSEPVEIEASNDQGVPATYEIVAEPEPASAGGAISAASEATTTATTIASGSFNPSIGSMGETVAINHAFHIPGSYLVTATFTDVLGETTSDSTVITVTGEADAIAPTTTAPTRAFATGATVTSGGSTPTTFAWSGADAGSGIDRYEAGISTDGGAYSTISTTLPSATLTRNLAAGHSYRLRVRAVDNAGNVGTWVKGATFTVNAYQEGSSRFDWTGDWTRPSNTSYWAGRERASTDAGAKVVFTSTGRNLAWIGSMGASRGSAKIFVDGVLVKTVSLNAGATTYRRVITTLNWSTAVSRKIKIVVKGTAGHPRVNVDAFVTGT